MSWSWLGVDLDGTLAEIKDTPSWDGSIGPPVPAMVDRVKEWLAQGLDVRIFTARVAPFSFEDHVTAREPAEQFALIEAWCEEHLGQKLPITCSKDYAMSRCYDDRAIQIERNTGRIIGESGGTAGCVDEEA